MNPKIGIYVIVIIAVVVLITGIGLVYRAKQIEMGKKERQVGITQTSEETVASEMVTDWRIYRNTEDGYEIKYPKDWLVSELPGKKVISIRNSNNSEEIIDIGKIESLKNIYIPPLSDDWIKNISINGLSAKVYLDLDGKGLMAVDTVIIDIPESNDFFYIRGRYDFDKESPRSPRLPLIDMQKTFYRIVSSFRLIK